MALVDWELHYNDTFEILDANTGELSVLRQVRGLPMGGHLSASLVELVALHCEHEHHWPSYLQNAPIARPRQFLFWLIPWVCCLFKSRQISLLC